MSNTAHPYVPINCSFYDYLEEAATHGQLATIEYREETAVRKIKSRIKTLFIENKVEYMMLENGTSIRLDYLVSFNGKTLPNIC